MNKENKLYFTTNFIESNERFFANSLKMPVISVIDNLRYLGYFAIKHFPCRLEQSF
jgi:hypothetical protein